MKYPHPRYGRYQIRLRMRGMIIKRNRIYKLRIYQIGVTWNPGHMKN